MLNPTTEPIPDIELRSEEVQEILGTPPKWLIRAGTTLVALIVMALLALSYYFKYPDKVPASIVVTTAVPPTNVVAETGGYIASLMVGEGAQVEVDELLGVIQNPADYSDVQLLESQVNRYAELLQEGILPAEISKRVMRLGELQSDWSDFVTKFEEYTFRQKNRYDFARLAELKKSIQAKEKQRIRDEEILKNAEEDYQIQEKELQRAQAMLGEGLISQQKYNTYIQSRLNARTRIEDIQKTLNSYESQIQEVRNEMAKVTQDRRLTDTDSFVELRESISKIQNSIDKWKQTYLLTAPRKGIVTFPSRIWTEDQYVEAGEVVLAIVPEETITQNDKRLLGRLSLPVRGSGKVDTMQKVLIRFDSYPYQEYGMVEGRVAEKSLIPKDNAYSIQVEFPNGLKTTAGRTLKFEQQMNGYAEIITEEKRFIERMLEKLLSAFRSNF